MYKPLPESLTIKASKVNGLGLFDDQAINHATNFTAGRWNLVIEYTVV